MQTLSPPSLLLVHLAVYGSVLALLAPGAGIWALVLAAPLIWASWVDTQRFEIPDVASAALALTGLGWIATLPLPGQLMHLAGGAIWPLVFWGVAALHAHLRGRIGLGFGDVKLMAGIGLWCGAADTITVVLGAALSGLAALSLSALTRPRVTGPLAQSKLAFAPFLCLFAWAVWLARAGT